MIQDRVALTLGREELVLVLRILQVPTLPGLEEDPLQGMSEEQAAVALMSAERSLRARGMLRVWEAENRIEIAPVVMALVGSCLKPSYSLLVSSLGNGRHLSTRYYHITDHLTVEHASTEKGLHTFTGVAKPEDMLPRVMDLLGMSSDIALQCPASRVRESILTAVRNRAGSGEMEFAREILIREGFAESTARALVEALAHPVSNSLVARIDLLQRREGQGFSVLEGPNAIWILTPQASTKADLWVKIESVQAEAVKHRLEGLLTAQEPTSETD